MSNHVPLRKSAFLLVALLFALLPTRLAAGESAFAPQATRYGGDDANSGAAPSSLSSESARGTECSGAFVYDFASGSLLAPKGAISSADEIGDAAGRARATVGPGKGGPYGTRVHTEFEGEVKGLGRPDLHTEVSYKGGEIVPRGTEGSVRLDVVQGASRMEPSAIFDLKTGSAKLTPARIAEIRSHLPPGFRNIPIQEVRP